MRLSATLPALAFLLLACTAWAQPASGTVFISGAAFAAIEKAPEAKGIGITAGDASGTVAGGALGIGVYLTPRVSARFEWSLTDALKESQHLGISPLAATSAAGLVFPGTTIVDQTYESRRSTAAGFALLGFHVAAGRASVEVLGGLGLVHQDMTTSYDVRILPAFGLPVPRTDYTASSYAAAAVVGADLAVGLTEHASIVPHVRAYALSGGLSLRPGLALRWTF